MTRLTGPIHIVGAGLLGTSVALAACHAGLEVWLTDINHEHLRTASGLGAGHPAPAEGAAQLTVVAVPPDHIAEIVVEALERGGVVTDVGSVKSLPLERISDHAGEDLLAHYVGSHPMAGSERSGPLAATAALFDGRAVGDHAARALLTRGDRPGGGAGPTLRCGARAPLAGGARPGGRPDLAPAAPARRTHRRAARRGTAGAPLALGPGRARRDQDRGRRPGHVDPDPAGEPRGRGGDPARRAVGPGPTRRRPRQW